MSRKSSARAGLRMADGLGSHGACGPKRAARPIPCDLSPLEVLGRLGDRPQPFLLDSADRSHPDGRYSLVGCDPWATLRAKDGSAWLEIAPQDSSGPPGGVRVVPRGDAERRVGDRVNLGSPLDALARVQAALRVGEPPPGGLPFGGGLVGYLAYDLGRSIEKLPRLAVDDLRTDDLCLGLYDWALVCDHGSEALGQEGTGRADALDQDGAGRAEALGQEGTGRADALDQDGAGRVKALSQEGTGRAEAQSHETTRGGDAHGDAHEGFQGTWLLVATLRRPAEGRVEELLDRLEAWLTPRLEAWPTPRLEARLTSRMEARLTPRLEAWPACSDPVGPPDGSPDDLPEVLASRTFSQEAYLAAVRRALEHIFAGDIYQVNLSQRFSVPAADTALGLYARLRRGTSAVFSAYLDTPSAKVLSLSPERFLKVRGQAVETCPIKGTRPRGATPEKDAALAAELTRSAKDLAELSMIVDLERNDLGRVCEAGSVRVASHAELYTLQTVHHTVTRVTGTLRPEVDAAALLRATFPGGSITGAPKIRSMEIIEDLEPTCRGPYTGSVGYIDYSGDLDLNIAIRTVVITWGMASVQVGGGIVADSDPQAEYDETLDKARALLRGLGASVDPT